MAGEQYNEIVYKAAAKILAGGGGTAADPTAVVGNVAARSADSGNPVKIGGLVSTTTPSSYTNATRSDWWFNPRGAGAVFISDASGSQVTVTNSGADGVSNVQAGVNVSARLNKYNGSTWDRDRKPNVFKRIASSAASGNPDFLKASAGDLVQFWGLCGATAAYLQVYNKASAPTIGSDTPVLTFPILANQAFSQMIPGGGAYFSTGIAFAFTTDAAGTTGSAAAAVTACNIIGA